MLYFIETVLLVLNKIGTAVRANVCFNQLQHYAVSISHTCSEATEDNGRKERSCSHCCRRKAVTYLAYILCVRV